MGGVPCNAALGSLWIGVECQRGGTLTGLEQRSASVRKLSTWEGIRALGARGLDTQTSCGLTNVYPAAARRMVSDMPSQPVFDRAKHEAIVGVDKANVQHLQYLMFCFLRCLIARQ